MERLVHPGGSWLDACLNGAQAGQPAAHREQPLVSAGAWSWPEVPGAWEQRPQEKGFSPRAGGGEGR